MRVNLRKLYDRPLTKGGRASPCAGKRTIIVDIAYRWIGSVVGFENNPAVAWQSPDGDAISPSDGSSGSLAAAGLKTRDPSWPTIERFG